MELNKIYNEDCIKLLQRMLDEGVVADWCITDPPYGISAGGVGGKDYNDRVYKAARRVYKPAEWDKERIKKEYFDLIFKVSKNQIIFGGNYYTDFLPPTKSWICWDKRLDDKNRNNFADAEFAWCSTGQGRVFHYLYNGMIQGDMKNKDDRFHPTQKPTQLFINLINFYTKPGDLILDPFVGSFTTAIAAHRCGRMFVGAETNDEYYKKGTARLNAELAQVNFFEGV